VIHNCPAETAIDRELVIALAGQPNSGKSTLFNAVAGLKVETGNFAGTSLTFTETSLVVNGTRVRLIDLPGTYSISSHDPAERVARDYLLSGKADLIINVIDSALLSRSLEFTLQLIEMQVPMLICLNMIDEAHRKGIEIDLGRLTELTGLTACPVVAVLGTGIDQLFREAIAACSRPYRPVGPVYDRDVEECIERLSSHYPERLRAELPLPQRFILLRLLEMDEAFERRVAQIDGAFVDRVLEERKRLAEMHNWPETGVLASHRHALVLDLYEKISVHHRGELMGVRERLDRILVDPIGGLVVMGGSVLATFYFAFFLGDTLSRWIERPFDQLKERIAELGSSLPVALLSGLTEGVVAGAAIVLPYLIPLLLLLAIFEDIGLLPRIAFMVDGVLHRVGLHGKSIIPLLLGFGCNVPAIMAARNLATTRERVITMLVIPFVTCSARGVIVLALAGKYLGPIWATSLYGIGLAVAMVVSFILSKILPFPSPGLIMEVPPLRRPYPSVVLANVWLRAREFIVIAWPVILIASCGLAILSYIGIDAAVNRWLSFLTVTILGLPESVGIALFLGLFRKELTLVMLVSALGTSHFASVLSQTQILVLVVFSLLYIPCIATISLLWKEGGWRLGLGSTALNFAVSVLLAGSIAHLAPYLKLFN
jgi:ferrous iron transport protein B